MAERAVPRDVAEQVLGHAIGGVEAAYQRSDLLERRREILEDWATHIAPLTLPYPRVHFQCRSRSLIPIRAQARSDDLESPASPTDRRPPCATTVRPIYLRRAVVMDTILRMRDVVALTWLAPDDDLAADQRRPIP